MGRAERATKDRNRIGRGQIRGGEQGSQLESARGGCHLKRTTLGAGENLTLVGEQDASQGHQQNNEPKKDTEREMGPEEDLAKHGYAQLACQSYSRIHRGRHQKLSLRAN